MTDFEKDLDAHVDNLTPSVPPPFDAVVARRDRRRTRRRAVVATVGASAVVAAIVVGGSALRPDGNATEPPPTAPENSPTSPSLRDVAPEWDEEGAPPVFLQLDDEQVVLEPWTSCFGNMCVDGMPMPPFADVGDREEVAFSFPLAGWDFEATFTPLDGVECKRSLTVPVASTGRHTFEVSPAGPPGDYQVDLFGSGPGGDAATTFQWSTTSSGEIPEPIGTLAVIADHDGQLDSYGLDLTLSDLGSISRDAMATVTVTAANGRSETFGPLQPAAGCHGAGTLIFTGKSADGARAVALGAGPFDYRVEVTLDGQTYVGTAVWPRDEKADEAPYTTLTFAPPLPAYSG
jgi:hypothetical protein